MDVKNEAESIYKQENHSKEVEQPSEKIDLKTISIKRKPKSVGINYNEICCVDGESAKGRFGWTIIDSYDMPFIFRPDGKYCALRMLEQKLLNKLAICFQKELLSCTFIRYFTATTSESSLLNSINTYHCNYQFGKERFGSNELLLSVQDATNLSQFFRCCYMKLEVNSEFDISKRCGFIRINKESIVPYSTVIETKFLPLFYFEGETKELKEHAVKLDGWELAYLKFCCKIQGIRSELFTGDSCEVVDLPTLKMFFPPNTLFEEFWPTRCSILRSLKNRTDEYEEINLSHLFQFDTPAISLKEYNCPQSNVSKRTTDLLHPGMNPKSTSITNGPSVLRYKRNSYYVGPHNNFPSVDNNYSRYKLHKIILGNHILNCINTHPNNPSDRWITLQDLISSYFCNVPFSVCEQVMEVLGIEIYRANSEQQNVLRGTGVYCSSEVLSLVQVDKIVEFWPQIEYMLKNIPSKH